MKDEMIVKPFTLPDLACQKSTQPQHSAKRRNSRGEEAFIFLNPHPGN